MKYIDIINHFWTINKQHSFTPNEKAVYFALLYKWNDLHRKNPFNLSNEHLTASAGMSVNAMKNARTVLKANGMIDFNSGDGRKINTNYVINDSIKGVSYRHLLINEKVSADDTLNTIKVSNNISLDDTFNEKKVSRGDDYISKLIEESTPDVKKGEEGGIKEESYLQKIPVPLGSSSVYSSMDDVEFICLNQSTIWHEHMTRKFELPDLESTKKLIVDFFDTMKAAGQDKRDLNDARFHCFNWINAKIQKEKSSGKKEKGKAEAILDLHTASTDYWDKVEQLEKQNKQS